MTLQRQLVRWWSSRSDVSMQLGLTKYYALSDAEALPRTLPGPAVLVYAASILLFKRNASSLVYLIAHQAVCLIEHCTNSDWIRCASQQQSAHLIHGPICTCQAKSALWSTDWIKHNRGPMLVFCNLQQIYVVIHKASFWPTSFSCQSWCI